MGTMANKTAGVDLRKHVQTGPSLSVGRCECAQRDLQTSQNYTMSKVG